MRRYAIVNALNSQECNVRIEYDCRLTKSGRLTSGVIMTKQGLHIERIPATPRSISQLTATRRLCALNRQPTFFQDFGDAHLVH